MPEIFELLKKDKPAQKPVQKANAVEIFELLKKSKLLDNQGYNDLCKTQEYVHALSEQRKNGQNISLALVDSSRLEEIFLDTIQIYGKALKEVFENVAEGVDKEKKWQIQEITRVLEQTSNQFEQILSVLAEMNETIQKLGVNADLEQEVLTQLNSKLRT